MTTAKAFSGTFDGDNKTTSGLNINNHKCYQGLYGYINNGTVKRLTVEGNITAGAGSAGLIACIENGKIENCINRANISNTDDSTYVNYINDNSIFIGGVCGVINGETKIINTTNKGNIKCNVGICNSTIAGGVVGFINEKAINTKIENCSNSAEVKINSVTITGKTALPSVGGIVGCLWEGKISKCNNTGKIYSVETSNVAYNTAGGIVGGCLNIRKTNDNKIEKCWNKGEIENSVAGGIVGQNTDYTVENCYNIGKVKNNYKCAMNDNEYALSGGGICGANAGAIQNCYNKGEIENNGSAKLATNMRSCASIGGIAGGSALGIISNCYNKGTIKALQSIEEQRGASAGGIIGTNYGNILNTYNEGNIITNGNSVVSMGGIVGWEYPYDVNRYINNVYNIGNLNEAENPNKASIKGGVVGVHSSTKTVWTNFCWLEGTGATHTVGTSTGEDPTKYTSEQIKNLITNGELPSTDWATDSNINNGYPHLKTFDDTTVWLRDSNINDGDPYLKENLPQ